ncbi:cyclin-like protein [Amylocarpus encephaloides]|uniref:Cyclin-like protein n=1 Tax=Amylocarpus encephaloides TaxID=45428 RepID=A0A9P8C735_9HELO|nr:cyclin-like protein [Amylocarpus encephaloides]
MAYRSEPCDTYFVESQDPYAQRSARDLIKLMGRQKQDAMAAELSRQASETYEDDIVKHMHQMEAETLPDVASIDIQQEIQWFMRPYLIDFLIEAHAAFQLLPETLFLAVNLLDRYCSRRVVYKRHYQLVGCAALLIAAKYGDKKDRVPMIRELKSMCCSLYDEEMFTQMEWHVLNTLDWVIGHPTVDTWMQLMLKDENQDLEVEHLASYLSEIALYHKDFVSKKPSAMAHASLAIARGILGRHEDRMEYHDHEVQCAMLELSKKLDRPSQVLYRKHASPHASRVSVLLEHFIRQQEEVQRQREILIARASAPTPPCESPALSKPLADMFPETPQKGYGNMVNGYMTPPITPNSNEYFGHGQMKSYQQAPRCPITPTPQMPPQPYANQHYQPYHKIGMHG